MRAQRAVPILFLKQFWAYIFNSLWPHGGTVLLHFAAVTRTLLADILPARSAVRAVIRTAFHTQSCDLPDAATS